MLKYFRYWRELEEEAGVMNLKLTFSPDTKYYGITDFAVHHSILDILAGSTL